jgi:anti-anti-sigma factor
MRTGTPFEIEERVEREGLVRLSLVGELDLATKFAVQQRLFDLRSRHVDVRLDLSRLEFIDASGANVLISALTEARGKSWRLELDRQLAPQVSRLLAAVGYQYG